MFKLHLGSFAKGFVCLKTYRLSLNAPLPLRQFDKFELFPVWGNLCSYSLSASLNINGNQLLAEKTGNVLQRKCCKIMMIEPLHLKNNFDFQFVPRILAHRYSWDLFAKQKIFLFKLSRTLWMKWLRIKCPFQRNVSAAMQCKQNNSLTSDSIASQWNLNHQRPLTWMSNAKFQPAQLVFLQLNNQVFLKSSSKPKSSI